MRGILNKTNKDTIRNNIRLELGVDEIKNDIKKSRLKWFRHVMWLREDGIPKKMLHKWRENDQEEDLELVKKDIEKRGEYWEEIK